MDFVKKNLFSVVCGVVAIVAIVASIYPVGGQIEKLKADTQTHAASYSAAEGLISKSRHLPVIDPDVTTPEDLKVFPNAKVIEEGTVATTDVSTQSKQMLQLVEQMNQAANPLLVKDALPAPLTDTPRYRFRDMYKIVLSTDPKAGLASDPQGPANLQNDILNGGMPPTQAEIAAAAGQLGRDVYEPRIIMVNVVPVNQAEVTAEFNAAVKKLPDEMRLKIANSKKVYVEPTAFTLNPNVIGNNAPAVVDIWFAQLGLWVQQNVAAGIAAANFNSNRVQDSPVKRLVSVYAVGNYMMNTTAVPTPTAADAGDVIAVPKLTAMSPTGRVSNPLYDVVQFQMVIDADAAQVPAVLQALCRNRLVDVSSLDMVVIDNADMQSRGYVYGNKPVVTLSLKCEALFMRQWEGPLMPDLVKTKMGVSTPVAGVPGAPATPAAPLQ